MLFKMAWDIIKRLWLIVPVILFLGTGFAIYNNDAAKTAVSLFTNGQTKTDIGQIIQQFTQQKPSKSAPTPTPWPNSLKVSIKTQTTTAVFTTEVADTPQETEIGYMYRPEIPEYNAMLFVFQNDAQYPFWMKNVEFSLDMIFLDADFKIVDIVKNAQPCKVSNPTQTSCPFFTPKGKYRYVLEVKGGSSSKLNITEESTVTLLK